MSADWGFWLSGVLIGSGITLAVVGVIMGKRRGAVRRQRTSFGDH